MDTPLRFPTELGTDAAGRIVSLADHPEKKFVIYFYPKDNTPGCTLEAQSFRDAYSRLADMGWLVIGVSKDSAASHTRFAEKHCLPFPLVVDDDLKLCEAAGVWQKKKMAGREYMGIVRKTFLVDFDGTVLATIDKVDTKNAAQQVLDAIAAL